MQAITPHARDINSQLLNKLQIFGEIMLNLLSDMIERRV